jgi:putative ATPase
VTFSAVEEGLGKQGAGLGQSLDNHYDLTSALIKSIRGSDPDASLYWLARMVVAGEDPNFICRRLLIAAAEDIGLADPNAMLVTNSCAQAAERVGYPEARYHLAMATVYLACAPKSNSLGAYFSAQDMAEKTSHLAPPAHLRTGGKYDSPHNHPGHYLKQNYWPEATTSQTFYMPGSLGFESKIQQRLDQIRQVRAPGVGD